MKQFMLSCLLLGAGSLFAQPPQAEKKDIEMDNTLIQTKRLTLALNLSDTQAQQVAQLLEAHKSQRPDRPEDPRSLSKDERIALHAERLDAQIALQRKMEAILSPDQFNQFRDMMEKKARKRKERRPVRRH